MSDGEAKAVPAVAPAGWYAHPTMADTQQYWDGHRWTDHVAPGMPAAHHAAAEMQEKEKTSDSLQTAGLVMMFIFPIGGFIAGCVLLARRPSNGVGLMIGSVISAVVWFQILYDPAPTYDPYGLMQVPWVQG